MTRKEYLELQKHNAFVDKVNFGLGIAAGISLILLIIAGILFITGGAR